MRLSFLFATGAASLIAAACGSSANYAAYEGPIGSTSSENGEKVFAQNCAGCHGARPKGPRLTSSNASVAKARAYIREGDGAMPAFDEKAISEEELEDLLAYLKVEFGMFASEK